MGEQSQFNMLLEFKFYVSYLFYSFNTHCTNVKNALDNNYVIKKILYKAKHNGL